MVSVTLDGKKVPIKLRSDDSVAQVRRKIAHSISPQFDPNDLCMWTSVSVLDDAASEIVAASSSPGGIHTSDLVRAYSNLVGSKAKANKNVIPHDSAVELVNKWGVHRGTIPVGARWANVRSLRSDGSSSAAAWWSFPMEFGPADPFDPSFKPREDMDLRKSGSSVVPWAEGESWLLEDYLRGSDMRGSDMRGDVLHVATRERVSEHLVTKDPKVLDLFFPLDKSETPDAVWSWDEYVDASLEALDSARHPGGLDISTTLMNCSTRMGSQGSSNATHFDTDSLYELFARFEVSHEVPCLVFHDGTSPTIKVFKDAIQTQETGELTANTLRRWKREAIGDRRRASLRAYCAVLKRPLGAGESQQYSSYVLNADLSAHILASGMGRYGPQTPEEQRTSLLRVGESIDRHVIHRIETLMKASDVSLALRSARIAMEQRQPIQKMSFRVYLNATRAVGKIPTVAQIQSAVVGRLSSVLTLVATVSGGKTILYYGRVAFASKLQRAQLVVRLMSARPKAEIEREMIGTFAMSPEDAKSFVEVTTESSSLDDVKPLYQGPVNYRMETVPVIELSPMGRMGYEATIINVARIEYVERINRLLNLLIASSEKLMRFPEMPYNIFSGSTGRTEPLNLSNDSSNDYSNDLSNKSQDNKGDEELDQWLEDEISGLESEPFDQSGDNREEMNPLDVMDAQDEKEERKVEEEDRGEEDEEDENPQNHLLTMLRKADRTLFKYPGSRYATDCARNMMRQPVVLSREDLERTNKLYPGGHTGAIVNYGTTPEKASKNAYICPEVWCPRSKVALSREQFEKLGRKCPSGKDDDVEEPLVFDSKYWETKGQGRGHNPGFLDRRKHPGGFCMPCCFIKPQQHFDRCGAKLEKGRDITDRSNGAISPNDTKYVRGADVRPLEPGRYGMLPGVLADALLGSKYKCGNRDDGSGQLTVTSQCFIRRGIPSEHTNQAQQFLECAAYILGHASKESMMKVVNESLSASVFLTLDGGRVARRWMDGLDPMELCESPGVLSDVSEWLKKDEEYVERFSIKRVALAASNPSPELLREILVRAAMLRYLDSWKEDDVRKIAPQSDGMLDLLSRPHPSINPNSVNLMLIESLGGGMTVTVPCASDGDVASRWRAKDPIGMILCMDRIHYEPIVRATLVRGGVHETSSFFADAHQRLATMVRGYLGTCATRGRERVSGIVWAMKNVGYRVEKQVVDCFFRLAGLIARSKADAHVIFVPLVGMNLPVLAGDVGSRLDIAYLGDVVDMDAPFKQPPSNRDVAMIESMFAKLSETSRVTGLRPKDRITRAQGSGRDIVGLRLANGGIVPLVAKALSQPLQYGKERIHSVYLEHLSALVKVKASKNVATEWADKWDLKEKKAWELKSRVVKALRADGALSSELVALRSSLHPFDIDSKRKEAARVIVDALKNKGSFDKVDIEELADAMLFGPKPLSLRKEEIKITDGSDKAIVFSEAELLAGEMDVLIQSLERIRHPKSDEMSVGSVASGEPSVAPSVAPVEKKEPTHDEEPKKPSAPFPLDEDTLVRYVGQKVDKNRSPLPSRQGSRITAHRSSTYKQRRVRLVTNVDVYAVIHLAHQMLFSDAPARLEDAVRAVQNALMTALISGDLDQNTLNGTLGKMLVQQQRKNRPIRKENSTQRQYVAGKLASAIAWRGSDYLASTFEISELAAFLEVDIRLIPHNQSQALVSAVTRNSRRASGSAPKPYVILMEQSEGGHTLALSPASSQESSGVGHRIFFTNNLKSWAPSAKA